MAIFTTNKTGARNSRAVTISPNQRLGAAIIWKTWWARRFEYLCRPGIALGVRDCAPSPQRACILEARPGFEPNGLRFRYEPGPFGDACAAGVSRGERVVRGFWIWGITER